jgi:triphosphatase
MKNTPIGAPSIAQTPCLRAGMAPHQALQAVVLETLRHLQANMQGIVADDDIEFVHQARVALRRLRSAKKTFADISSDETWQSVEADIQWLGKLLGNARDLDVFLMQTLPPIETALCLDADFSPLKQAMFKRRAVSRRKILTALNSTRYRALQLRLHAWGNEDPPQPASDSRRLRSFARRSLNKRWRQVHRLAQNGQALDREQRHELRKKAKVLRYAVEFFSALYPAKPVERYLARLQSVQQILGVLNDKTAAQLLIAEFIKKDASLESISSLVFGWLACEATRSETYLAHAIMQLEKTKAYWQEK